MSFPIVSCRKTGVDWCKSPGDHLAFLELPDAESTRIRLSVTGRDQEGSGHAQWWTLERDVRLR